MCGRPRTACGSPSSTRDRSAPCPSPGPTCSLTCPRPNPRRDGFWRVVPCRAVRSPGVPYPNPSTVQGARIPKILPPRPYRKESPPISLGFHRSVSGPNTGIRHRPECDQSQPGDGPRDCAVCDRTEMGVRRGRGRLSAFAALVGFAAVMTTWLGVSYLPGLAGGLHTYASPTG